MSRAMWYCVDERRSAAKSTDCSEVTFATDRAASMRCGAVRFYVPASQAGPLESESDSNELEGPSM